MDNGTSVVGIGELLWDVLPEGKKLGGAPANFAYHVSQLGISSCAISAVGDDQLGHDAISQLNQRHLSHIIETVPFPTGTVNVEIDGNGIPSYKIEENVAWDSIPFSQRIKAAATGCTAVCFGSLAQRSAASRQTVYSFLDAMPDDDRHYRIFDINLRQEFFTAEIIRESISRCNILKINDEELAIVSRMFGYHDIDVLDQCKRMLGEYALKMLILTCGVDGSYVVTSEGVSFAETPKVTVADTVGAGDSFTAAFVAALLHGKGIREAHECAVKVSAYVCTQNGAMPILPDSLKSLCK